MTTLNKLLAALDFQPLGRDARIAYISEFNAESIVSVFGDFISVPNRKNIESGTVIIGGDANQIKVYLYDNIDNEYVFQIPFEVN